MLHVGLGTCFEVLILSFSDLVWDFLLLEYGREHYRYLAGNDALYYQFCTIRPTLATMTTPKMLDLCWDELFSVLYFPL